MRKYNFPIRLFIGIPILCFSFVLWIFLFLYSTESLGKVLKKTGQNLLDE